MITDWDLDRYLQEDVPYGDLTTQALGIADKKGGMDFFARQPMVAACVTDAVRLIRRSGANAECVTEGMVEAGTPLLRATGSAGALLSVWKVAQTLVEMCSGMATSAHAIVRAARSQSPGCVVACTRKNFPGTRAASVRSIQAGGAVPHRLGLSDSVLIFPEHWIFAPDIPLEELIARAARHCPEKKVVMEVTSPETALLAARAGADVVQLEKFTPDQASKVVQAVRGHGLGCKIAAAGGIQASNAAEYAASGVDVLVTSAPYHAPPMDVAVRFSALD